MSSALGDVYGRRQFISIIEDFLPDVILDTRSVPSVSSSFAEVVSLGSSPALDLQIFEVRVSGSLEKRVSIATDAFRLMKQTASYRSLVAFHSEETDQWRLSLLTAKPTIDEGKVVTRFSSPKRYSYLLGPGSKLGTPAKQLIVKGRVTDFEDLSKRFAVEVVNDEFYKEIANLYDELVGANQISGVLKYPSEKDSKHEFAVRLIGRIIFCWFLREKQSGAGTALISSRILSREAANEINYYHSTLAPLFFEVLNKRLRNREERFQGTDFATIPYLNGGLFSPDADDYYKFNKGSQKSEAGKIDVPNDWLDKFFDLLEMYNFTVDENTSFDIDLSIDPEMLGRVFENLLARINPETGETVRKGTGSFYTPREIVEYMVDQSLCNYLVQFTSLSQERISALVNYDLAGDDQLKVTIAEKQEVLNALSVVKILDPACGSGAFPMGILQKIVFILQQVDPDAKQWLQKQLLGAGPELRRHLEEEFGNKNFDYLRKLGVIRESIYGVDIQPIATEISRLRCFLTLVVDQSVKDDAPNRGIEPLPNLDFKFVTANSLIKLPAAHTGQIDLFDDQEGIAELKEIRSEYFTAGESERDQIKYRFAQVQKSMFQRMIAGKGFADLTQKLSAWDPFTHKATDWFDEEWMFGITDGFNVVIANPPYIDSEGMINFGLQYLREYIADQYTTTKGNWDIYIAFFEKGLSLLGNNGVLVYISPDKWISKPFGDELRKRNIKTLYSVLKAGRRVFESAKVDSIITMFTKQNVETLDVLTYEDERVVSKKNIDKSIMSSPYQLDYLFSDHLEFLIRLGRIKGKLSDIGECENACATSDAYKLKPFVKDAAEGFVSESQLKIVNTGTISKYVSRWGVDKMTYLKDKYLRPVVDKSQFLEAFANSYGKKSLKPKIIIKGLNLLDACLDAKGEVVPGKTTLIITGGSLEDLKFLLGVINSKLAFFYIKERYPASSYNQGIGFTKDMINSFPLPDTSADEKRAFVSLVDKILASGPGQVSQKLIGQVDELVYGLYGLTSEEVSLIEGRGHALE